MDICRRSLFGLVGAAFAGPARPEAPRHFTHCGYGCNACGYELLREVLPVPFFRPTFTCEPGVIVPVDNRAIGVQPLLFCPNVRCSQYGVRYVEPAISLRRA